MIFEKGDVTSPRGHAILYYRSSGVCLATYIMVLPLKLDLEKFIPPVMISQVKASGIDELTAFAIPPALEEVPSHEFLLKLAEQRFDDLVFGGEVSGNDFLDSAQRVSDAVKEYADLCQKLFNTSNTEEISPSEISDLSVNEVLFSMMPEREALGELSKMIGKMQFALEGHDDRLAQESVSEITALSRHLPESYQLTDLIKALEGSSSNRLELARLYLERCYKLLEEDYAAVSEKDDAIRQMQGTFD